MSGLLAKLFDVVVHAQRSLRGQLEAVLGPPHTPHIKAATVRAVLRRRLFETYDRLAREADVIGDERTARDWRLLANDCSTRPQDDSLAGLVTPEDSDLRWTHADVWRGVSQSQLSAFQTRYAIWAFAVRNEVSVRDELVAVAAFAEDRKEKARALRGAREAARRAAKYRVMRRVAYHSEERRQGTVAFPAVNRIQTLDDIGHVAGAIEAWLEVLLSARSQSGDAFVEALRITHQAKEICIMLTASESPHKRLQQGLRRIATFVRTFEPGDIQPSQAKGQVISECERVFDYYDSLFESSEEPDTLKAAQVLSRLAVARIVALRGVAPVEHVEPSRGPSS